MKSKYIIGTVAILALILLKSYLDVYSRQRLIESVKCPEIKQH